MAVILLVIHRQNPELPQQLLLAITTTIHASLRNAVSTLQSPIGKVIVRFVSTIRNTPSSIQHYQSDCLDLSWLALYTFSL